MHTRESVRAVAVGDFGEVLLSRVTSIMTFQRLQRPMGHVGGKD
jgi:hypothetical protein